MKYSTSGKRDVRKRLCCLSSSTVLNDDDADAGDAAGGGAVSERAAADRGRDAGGARLAPRRAARAARALPPRPRPRLRGRNFGAVHSILFRSASLCCAVTRFCLVRAAPSHRIAGAPGQFCAVSLNGTAAPFLAYMRLESPVGNY